MSIHTGSSRMLLLLRQQSLLEACHLPGGCLALASNAAAINSSSSSGRFSAQPQYSSSSAAAQQQQQQQPPATPPSQQQQQAAAPAAPQQQRDQLWRSKQLKAVRAYVFEEARGNGRRSGRQTIMKPLKGRWIADWYFTLSGPKMPMVLDELEEERQTRVELARATGSGPPKKGQGKRAKK